MAARSFDRRAGGVYPIFEDGKKDGKFYANIPQCTRKDLRNSVEAAAKAGPDWARRTPYNRGQILYRLGEMIEARGAEMAEAHCCCERYVSTEMRRKRSLLPSTG